MIFAYPFGGVVNRPAVESLIEQSFGGMRIEDTIHVRTAAEGGPEVLTSNLPTDADAVTAILAGN